MAYDKYQKLKLQYSYNGNYWSDVVPPRYKVGELIEENSPDCGGYNTIYRWYALPDEYVCEGYNKHYKEVYQQSKNEGLTWTNVSPEQTRTGALIEANSIDCGYGISWEVVPDEYICETRTASEQWVVIPDEYVCDGSNKYYKEKLRYCYNNECFDSAPLETRAGQIYLAGCTMDECMNGTPRYQWVEDGDIMVSGDIRYIVEKEQISYDCGNSWENTGNTKNKYIGLINTKYITADVLDDVNYYDEIKDNEGGSISYVWTNVGKGKILTSDNLVFDLNTRTVYKAENIRTTDIYGTVSCYSSKNPIGATLNDYYYNVDTKEFKTLVMTKSVDPGVYDIKIVNHNSVSSNIIDTHLNCKNSCLDNNHMFYYHNNYFYCNIPGYDNIGYDSFVKIKDDGSEIVNVGVEHHLFPAYNDAYWIDEKYIYIIRSGSYYKYDKEGYILVEYSIGWRPDTGGVEIYNLPSYNYAPYKLVSRDDKTYTILTGDASYKSSYKIYTRYNDVFYIIDAYMKHFYNGALDYIEFYVLGIYNGVVLMTGVDSRDNINRYYFYKLN